MTLSEMTIDQLADEWRAIHRCVHQTSMSAKDLYRMIHLDMELERRGLEPVTKVELKEIE